MFSLRSLLPLAFLALPVNALADTWTFDAAHSVANFKVRHLMVTNVNGTFGAPTGSLSLDEKDVTKSSINAESAMSSIGKCSRAFEKFVP